MTPPSPRSLAIAFLALWLALVVNVLTGSVETFVHVAGRGLVAPSHFHLAVLAGIETVAVVLFLIPRTLRLGGSVLLVVFLAALLIHGLEGQIRVDILLDAAVTLYIMLHGPVAWSVAFGKEPTGA